MPYKSCVRGAMEALRTKVDGLQWELHRLEAENLRLREANPEASESLDQLERKKSEAAELADRVQELERKLEETAESTGDAETRARRAELRVRELESQELEMRRLSEEDLAKAHRELEELAARCESEEKRSQAARDALRQEAELERYRAMEEERTSGKPESLGCLPDLRQRRRSYGSRLTGLRTMANYSSSWEACQEA